MQHINFPGLEEIISNKLVAEMGWVWQLHLRQWHMAADKGEKLKSLLQDNTGPEE